MHPLLNTAIKAARRAGQVIVRYADRIDRLAVESKGPRDFVTEVDRMAEEEIIRIIRHSYPDHGILAEESGSRPGATYEWIIDPLDGTTNYLHGFPQYAVSIAVRRAGHVEQAVVFDPLRDELFTASAGRGAQLNERRVRVSRVPRLAEALLATGFPFRELAHLDTWLATLRTILPRTSGVRRAGSAALDLAYVACGRCDGFWELGLSAWDVAAGALLVIESGGLITDAAGGAGFLDNGNVVAGNPDIHAQLLQLVRAEMRATQG